MDKILNSREERINNIKGIVTSKPILAIKANIPGSNKNINESYIILRIFRKLIYTNYQILNEFFYDSFDGPYYLLVIDEETKKLKYKMMDYENNHPLGRFIDLDVYDLNKNNVSRSVLGYPKRKCMICDEDAFICIRSRKHSLNELIEKISVSLENYVLSRIEYYLRRSFLLELNLHPKFGLVTPYSQGSHIDMDYQLMINAQEVIIPGLLEMFTISYHSKDLLVSFNQCRKLGLDLEKQMLQATKDINAYKGAIFIQGLVMISLAYLLKNNQKYDGLYENIISMSQYLLCELETNPSTDGLRIYNMYKIGGARKEAYLGLPNVKEAVKNLNSYSELSYEAIIMTLVQIIASCEDTVMIKRSLSWDNYLIYKNLITSIKEYDYNKINEITNIFIKNNISCGGSADLLIASIFIKLIFDEFID